MINCRSSGPARQRIQAMLAAGNSEQQILDAFVKDVGLKVLVQPPTEGFYLLGWTMPAVGLISFSAIMFAVIKKMREPVAAVEKPAGQSADPAEIARYEQMIEKEMDKL
jgi:cytochrome c-type biogenesis protein CcmH/NrfF